MKQHITKTVHSITFLFIFFFFTNVNAQNIAIEQDGACINCPNATTSDPSAALEVRAIDRGVLIPRLANTSAVANHVEGLMIYDRTFDVIRYYDGFNWRGKEMSYFNIISFSTFIGRNISNSNTGDFNTAIGYSAMSSNTVGGQNVATGGNALYSNTSGYMNTAFGYNAGFTNTTGTLNTAVGFSALYGNNTGKYNTAIGHSAFISGNSYNNSTALGYQAQPTGSNQVRLGNDAVTSIGGYTNWSNISDARFKTAVQNDVPGLAFISLLNPVTYQMDMDAIAKHHHTPDSLRLAESERAKAAIRYTGFLAQDVEKAAESIGYNFSGVDAPQHERDNYSLRYAEFVVPLVKAVQELEAENKALRAQHADLEARLGKIEALLRQRAE